MSVFQRPFTKGEIEHLWQTPEALETLADYHDAQASMGDAMGYDVTGNEEEADALRILAQEMRGTIKIS